MLRRIMTATVLALVGLFAVAGTASAAPTSYPPPASVVVAVNTGVVNIVDGKGTVTFSGSGFLAGEAIRITVVYSTPDGQQSTGATYYTVADANGNFSLPVTLTQVGTATLTAFGETSGRTASLTVVGVAAGVTTPVEATTTVAGSTETSTQAAAAGSGDGSGLAYTGTSIAGPLTIGASALIAGLALLFFGTRLAIRRRHGSAH